MQSQIVESFSSEISLSTNCSSPYNPPQKGNKTDRKKERLKENDNSNTYLWSLLRIQEIRKHLKYVF